MSYNDDIVLHWPAKQQPLTWDSFVERWTAKIDGVELWVETVAYRRYHAHAYIEDLPDGVRNIGVEMGTENPQAALDALYETVLKVVAVLHPLTITNARSPEPTMNVCDLALRILNDRDVELAKLILSAALERKCEKHPHARMGVALVEGEDCTKLGNFCAECNAHIIGSDA